MMANLLKTIRQKRADKKWFKSIQQNRSRLNPDEACRHTDYLNTCRQAFREHFELSQHLKQSVAEFNEKGFTSWWDAENAQLAQSIFDKVRQEEQSGQSVWDDNGRYTKEIYQTFPEIEQLFQKSLGRVLQGVYQANFKIFYGIMYKSERQVDSPNGSQLWHADGGPGTCINVMFVLKDLASEDGAMELLPWKFTEEVFSKERPEVPLRLEAAQKNNPSITRLELRRIKTEYFSQQIEASYKDRIEQPIGRAGLVLPFRNNVLHKGGFPEPGRARYVCVFHVYPSHKSTDWRMYRTQGVPKRGPYLKIPSNDF